MLVRLEQNFSAAMQRSLTKRKALAMLYGRHLLYYMTKTEVFSHSYLAFALVSRILIHSGSVLSFRIALDLIILEFFVYVLN